MKIRYIYQINITKDNNNMADNVQTVVGFAASASSYDAAEEQAKAQAESSANDLYGQNGWTQTSFAEVNIKANTDLIRQPNGTFNEVVTGYTGTYTLRVEPIQSLTPTVEPETTTSVSTPQLINSMEESVFDPRQEVTESVFDPGQTFGTGDESVFDPGQTNRLTKTTPSFDPAKDWRVRISLAKSSDYLYNAKPAGILAPLLKTNGVIFPYTPTIQVSYTAKYDSQMPTHSNYQIHTYQGSAVESLTITGEFTAQSVTEANYLLAVIHFFKSATKMFYGKDQNRGVPPPLLYLSGYGQYQFDNHPMVLAGFNYSLPNDVDYVDAYSTDDDKVPNVTSNGVLLAPFVQPKRDVRPSNIFDGISRLLSAKTKVTAGGKLQPNEFKNSNFIGVTRVPSKISITLTLHPMITRNAITNHFGLKDYATGKLLRGSQNSGTGGGIW